MNGTITLKKPVSPVNNMTGDTGLIILKIINFPGTRGSVF